VATTYAELPNKLISAANGVDYAYREAGDGEVPLVLLQHFRGNLDSWDPALIDALEPGRRVVTFDNTGVGGSSGQTPDTVRQMARDAIAFITALGSGQADILGFSIGSFVAQEIALIRPTPSSPLISMTSWPGRRDGHRLVPAPGHPAGLQHRPSSRDQPDGTSRR
jgi:pimeloyl-ACP methyl ester carboxylesterase